MAQIVMDKRRSIVLAHEDFDQQLEIASVALQHMRLYRQVRSFSREAGGQLFGSVDNCSVRILEAHGPRRADERTRTSFRSDPAAAQRDIDQCARRGLLYLGEWHTHPEPRPTASSDDKHALSLLIRRSRLRLNVLFMVIQGVDSGEDGISVYCNDGSDIKRWNRIF